MNNFLDKSSKLLAYLVTREKRDPRFYAYSFIGFVLVCCIFYLGHDIYQMKNPPPPNVVYVENTQQDYEFRERSEMLIYVLADFHSLRPESKLITKVQIAYPDIDQDVCRLALLTEDVAQQYRLIALANRLNGEGCEL